MNELYPLKFEPILKDKIWGGDKLKNILGKDKASSKCGESWEISAVANNISVVRDGFLKGNNLQELIEVYMGDLVGDRIYEKFGLDFPLLIKFIDANDLLSIQVHPDDEMAKERHNTFGKTEMWYIIQADEEAELISGFKSNINRDTYIKHLESRSLQEILNYADVEKGDVFFLPSGRIHSIGAGILLAEIQQTSDITYRIYDWDRVDKEGNSRELHIDQAADAINYNAVINPKTYYSQNKNKTNPVIDCEYFTTSYIVFDTPVEKDFIYIDSFVIYMCLDGKLDVTYNHNDRVEVEKGETLLVPAMIKNISIHPQQPSELLEIYIK